MSPHSHTSQPACRKDLHECYVCPPKSPEQNAFVIELDINVVKILDDIRIERNGDPIIDDRHTGIGNYTKILIASRYGLKQGDIITFKVFAKGATFVRGAWSVDVKYAVAGVETVVNYKALLDSAPIAVTPGQEYYQFAQFIL